MPKPKAVEGFSMEMMQRMVSKGQKGKSISRCKDQRITPFLKLFWTAGFWGFGDLKGKRVCVAERIEIEIEIVS